MDNRQRIQRLGAVLQAACAAYLVLAPLLLIVVWANFEAMGYRWETLRQLPILPEYVGPLNLWLGFAVSAVPVALLMYGVWRLRQLFGQYRRGVLFDLGGAEHLLAFARMLFITVLLTPVVSALLSLVLTMSNPPGQRAITVSLGSNDVGQLFIAGLLLAIAWILREGHRLQSENEAFV